MTASNPIGIITNNQHNVFQRHVILGIREIAAARGYDVVIDSYAEDPDHPQPVTLDYRAMAGVLSIADAAPVALLRAMVAEGVPVSLVSHYVPELAIPAVVADNTAGIVALVRHAVVDCGRRDLVYIQGIAGQRDSEEREAAFLQEVLRYNLHLPPEHLLPGGFDANTAAAALRDLIDSGTQFDAVIAADYLMGIAALHTLRDAGFLVPEEVCVLGFGDATEAADAGLTTVSADVVEQGRRAARQLISQIEGLLMRGLTVLSVELIVRDTCCPVPGTEH